VKYYHLGTSGFCCIQQVASLAHWTLHLKRLSERKVYAVIPFNRNGAILGILRIAFKVGIDDLADLHPVYFHL